MHFIQLLKNCHFEHSEKSMLSIPKDSSLRQICSLLEAEA